MNKKLTVKTLSVLRELQKGRAIYMCYLGRFNPNPYYFLTSTHEKCTSQIRALVCRGLAERSNCDEYGDRHDVRITKAGKEFLRKIGRSGKQR